jgi:SAM-dependent methyltransferase
VTERARTTIEQFQTGRVFDLATLRMVAEHIPDPEAAVAALARLVRSGGTVVVYTINKWAPVSLVSYYTPFWLHHPIKKMLWNTEEKDTFPVCYRMNTRRRLKALFERFGFQEQLFCYLDDCRLFHRSRLLNGLELFLWRMCKALNTSYPETCILGVYQRDADAPHVDRSDAVLELAADGRGGIRA